MWYLYILLCKDGSLRKRRFRKLSLYTGISNNVEKRFLEHKNGKGGKYTRSHKPVRLVYQEKLASHSAALKREFEIKNWTRVKKEALINGDLEKLKNL
ncbi:MAG: GIY-YIG nuclease family protein [Candidatus Daviesbacteria bacterium]|nr:GIY-YIG nuclease family protein [Candidatus Daviesbacteria bacterium]